jgi:UDP-N-acetylglucosamine 2-epimerase (non-hydrolysing)
MGKKKILSVFGTRPEVIKMAPILKELDRHKDIFESNIILTGQHKEMVHPYLALFGIEPHFNLEIMTPNQSVNNIAAKILEKLPPLLDKLNAEIVLVQGDTTSAFASALVGFHAKIKVGHIEAGLRTYNKFNPFPEEMNRCLISSLADFHFAPTENARNNLLNEGVNPEKVFITGNTVIDALLSIVRDDYKFEHEVLKKIAFNKNRIICVTTHRRESFGLPLKNTLTALKKIIELYSDIEIVLPVHYNPNVKKHVYDMLGNTDRIHLIEPLSYEPFVQLLNKSFLILTDSGGVQEEAPSLGKPVLVLRDTTERPEGIEAGTAKLVGTNVENIIDQVGLLLDNKDNYHKMANSVNPYGDGTAALKIINILKTHS